MSRPAPTKARSDRPGAVTTIVVPTVGRESLVILLDRLAHQSLPVSSPVIVVDDRAAEKGGAVPAWFDELPYAVKLLVSGGRGPAAARNLGWRHARTPWVSFVDDDVVPAIDWYASLLADLEGLPADVHGSQGRLHVPLPAHRRPDDWERATAGLEDAPWITADLTYRRSALVGVGGFDERFPRAYREDVDLGLRITAAGGRIEWGQRTVEHPVRPVDGWVSVRRQSGNADDALMRRLHGADWRRRAQVPRGRFRRHAVTVGSAAVAALAAAHGRRRVAVPAALLSAALTAEFATARILPGPRSGPEVRRMVATSAAIPFAAVAHSMLGRVRHRHAAPWTGPPDLVLLDRDGTIVHDVPYNADPDAVHPFGSARDSLDRLRDNGIRVGVVTNQSGVGRGLISPAELDAVNQRVADLLGPFDVWCQCLHAPEDSCDCRKPSPQLVIEACDRLDVDPTRTVLVGDIGADLLAAQRAGARGVLVPTPETRPEEVTAAAHVRRDLGAVVDDLLGGHW
ncbi:HAD-IIIA family hydrolase [Humibacillus xanthopallidus]|uniref:D,D-heptose 1,7-bisphosphate phosphatase n=1 Tax=Humibacillus xanthopallidus TaxID=412689 RepID=A0A543HHV6_9MICO|nr:HAD-IIIA family hydrolase [Humibacillus xanthopallidus]TQM57894.1 histidinol-phosphate phosphatase family protein/HAD superfamily hydrolase (TIGR01662 family) [Humibacillus xanthopallidus]